MSDEIPAGMKACPFCGEEIRAVAIKCKHCGEMLTGLEPGDQVVQTRRASSARVVDPPIARSVQPGVDSPPRVSIDPSGWGVMKLFRNGITIMVFVILAVTIGTCATCAKACGDAADHLQKSTTSTQKSHAPEPAHAPTTEREPSALGAKCKVTNADVLGGTVTGECKLSSACEGHYTGFCEGGDVMDHRGRRASPSDIVCCEDETVSIEFRSKISVDITIDGRRAGPAPLVVRVPKGTKPLKIEWTFTKDGRPRTVEAGYGVVPDRDQAINLQ